jgi:guanyl-specific ribonuclease Sa
MTRIALGIPLLLVTVFIGMYLMSKDAQQNAQTSSAGQQAISQANAATAGVDFNQAVPALQAYFDENHTYVGATLPPGSEVALAAATTTGYCLQSGNEHEDGPGGTPQPGPC